jgi:hypothetical protein
VRTIVRHVVSTEIFQTRSNKARWKRADFDFSGEDFSGEDFFGEDFFGEIGSADSATGGKKFVNPKGLAQGSATVRQNMAIGTSAKERIKALPQHSPTRVHISATNQIYLLPGASRGRHKILVDRIIITNEPLRR